MHMNSICAIITKKQVTFYLEVQRSAGGLSFKNTSAIARMSFSKSITL
jgi:hypothetical protein